jgi:diaminopimelate decarboxylase
MKKTLPFDETAIRSITEKYPTPFHIYDEKGITENARRFMAAFSWNPGFKQYFAVKATPNPHIVKLLHQLGMGADCSSMAELVLCKRLGIRGSEIMFTSNDTPLDEYQKATELGAIINLDDLSHIDFLKSTVGIPETVCMRYNPGDKHLGNDIIGKPHEAKFGIPKEQLLEGYRRLKELGVKHFGLHTMIVSNELNPRAFKTAARMMFELAVELHQATGIKLEFINLGGGIGIPYRPEQQPIDMTELGRQIESEYRRTIVKTGLHPLKIFTECGRCITGPYGYLVSRVLHQKKTYKHFIGLDACMVNLMRPAIYGAYHHVTVVGKEHLAHDQVYDLTGSLCENNDKFAIDRKLPKIETGDLVVIHDTGAHGHAMGFNYNGKLRSAEVLLKPNGSTRQIRRAENLEDLFATLEFGEPGPA